MNLIVVDVLRHFIVIVKSSENVCISIVSSIPLPLIHNFFAAAAAFFSCDRFILFMQLLIKTCIMVRCETSYLLFVTVRRFRIELIETMTATAATAARSDIINRRKQKKN